MDIAERMQCPIDFPAVGLMVAAGAVIGRRLGIRPKRLDDWTVVPNLWGAIVGRPAVLKTPALAEALAPLNRLETATAQEYEKALQRYAVQCEVAKLAKEVARTKAKAAIKAHRDPNAPFEDCHKPEPPKAKRYITQDATVEKLGELLADNPAGILVMRDELSGFLRNMDRDGHQADRAFYLEAWNGTGPFTYDRIVRGTIRIPAACVSVLGTIQPGPLQGYLLDALNGTHGDDGLIQRFQLVVWPDVSLHWANVDRKPDVEARRRAFDCFVSWSESHFEEAIIEDDSIPFYRFNKEAQEAFDDWRSRFERKLRNGDEHPALEAHFAKYRSLLPALALICHVGSDGRGPVSLEALQCAIGWINYLTSHARRLYAEVESPNEACGRELALRIKKGQLGRKFTKRDVYRPQWRKLQTKGKAAAAVEYLFRHHWLEEETVDTNGRPTTIYVVNPLLSFYQEIFR